MTFREFKENYRNMSEEDRKKFINDRLQEFINNSMNGEIGLGVNRSYSGFIGSSTELSSNTLFPNMKFDDYSIYEDFFNSFNNDIDTLTNEPALISYIQNYIYKYFGYNTSNMFERMEAYDTPDWKAVSIKNLKGKNIAACSERSAMAQNLITFMGLDSEIVFGKLNDSESHAYIIFQPEKNNGFRILYDPMNPVEYEKDGQINYGIGVSRIDEESYLKLKAGEPFEFNYDLVKRLYGQDNKYYELERKYTCDDIKYQNEQVEKIKTLDNTFIATYPTQTNSKEDLVDFYVKKYNKIRNTNITKEQFIDFMQQKQPNLSENERMAIIYRDFKENLSNDEKDKVFDYFKKIDVNIKSEDDLTAFIQNTKLKSDMLSNPEKLIEQNGKLVTIPANSEQGFNYPFMIYIPNNLDATQTNNLLLHSCNTPEGMLDYSKVEEYTKINQLNMNSLQIEMANKGNTPLIMPIIPRFKGYNPEYIENGKQLGSLEDFIKIQSQLDPKYQMTRQQIEDEYNKSQNIINQQMNMSDYAISYLRNMGISMDDKIMVEGHSAGSKNTASIINQYPDRIASYVIGGTTGRAIINDKSIPGIVYNGKLDKNNPAEFYYDNNGIPRAKYKEEFSDKSIQDIVVPEYKKSLEEWKKENPNKDVKEFNVVQHDIQKQHRLLGDKGILVEEYGHNAINSPEVRQKAVEIVKNKSVEKLPDISQSTDIREIAYVIQKLNPTADIRIGNPTMMSNANEQFYSSIPMDKIKLPNGFEYNEKGGITNKHMTESGSYTSLKVSALNSVDPNFLMSKSQHQKYIDQKFNNKTQNNENKQSISNNKPVNNVENNKRQTIQNVDNISSQKQKSVTQSNTSKQTQNANINKLNQNISSTNNQKQTIKNSKPSIEAKPIKKESKQVPKTPSIPPKRTNEKQVKKNQPMKMNNIEKKVYPPLKQKQTLKVQAITQTKTKANTMTYKKPTSTGSKGYINIILASIITILIVLGVIIVMN